MQTPRQTFQKLNKEDVAQLALTLDESWFKRCVIAALAEIAFATALSTPEVSGRALLGANTFLKVLHDLAAETPAEKQFSAPELSTYDPQVIRKIESQARSEISKHLTES